MKFLLFLLLATLPLSAQIVFETYEVKRDPSPKADKVTLEFPFTIQGNAVEIIGKESPCSCLSALVVPAEGDPIERATWQPGESGKVVATFEIGTFKGSQSKAILLTIKGQEDPIQLVATINIPILLDITPATHKWPVNSAAETRIFKLTVPGENPVQIIENSGTNPNFPYELKTITPGREWEIHVTPKQTDRPAFGMIRLKTDSQVPRYQNAQIFVVVEKKR